MTTTTTMMMMKKGLLSMVVKGMMVGTMVGGMGGWVLSVVMLPLLVVFPMVGKIERCFNNNSNHNNSNHNNSNNNKNQEF